MTDGTKYAIKLSHTFTQSGNKGGTRLFYRPERAGLELSATVRRGKSRLSSDHSFSHSSQQEWKEHGGGAF